MYRQAAAALLAAAAPQQVSPPERARATAAARPGQTATSVHYYRCPGGVDANNKGARTSCGTNMTTTTTRGRYAEQCGE
jgi:hypothetical protein